MKKILILLVVVFGSSVVLGQMQRGIRFNANGGAVIPVSGAMDSQYGQGYGVNVGMELFTLVESRLFLINGGLETGYYHFSEERAAMTNIPAMVFVNMGLRMPSGIWRLRTGVGVGLFSNYTSQEIRNEEVGTYFGYYVPVGLNFRLNRQTRFVLQGRGYRIYGMIGYEDINQVFAAVHLGFEYFLPL